MTIVYDVTRGNCREMVVGRGGAVGRAWKFFFFALSIFGIVSKEFGYG